LGVPGVEQRTAVERVGGLQEIARLERQTKPMAPMIGEDQGVPLERVGRVGLRYDELTVAGECTVVVDRDRRLHDALLGLELGFFVTYPLGVVVFGLESDPAVRGFDQDPGSQIGVPVDPCLGARTAPRHEAVRAVMSSSLVGQRLHQRAIERKVEYAMCFGHDERATGRLESLLLRAGTTTDVCGRRRVYHTPTVRTHQISESIKKTGDN